MKFSRITGLIVVLLIGILTNNTLAQETENELKIITDPEVITLDVGQELQLKAMLVNTEGEVQPDTMIYFSRARRSLSVTRSGLMKALEPGSYSVIVYKQLRATTL